MYPKDASKDKNLITELVYSIWLPRENWEPVFETLVAAVFSFSEKRDQLDET